MRTELRWVAVNRNINPGSGRKDDPTGAPRFMDGASEMARRTREYDWSASALGPAESWPTALQTLLAIMLGSNQPMFVTWGPERRMLYNDGYAPLLGMRHPEALGSRFDEVWFDIIDEIGPISDKAYAGESVNMDDILLVVHRNGYAEETHFSFSYNPVRIESGEVAGMFCACNETTAAVLAERRRLNDGENLRQLFDRAPGFMAVIRGPDHIFEMANESFARLVGRTNLVGKSIRETLPELAGQGFYELLDKVYRTGEPFNARGARIKLQRVPDDPIEERLLDFVYQPILDAEGQVTGIFAEGYDVTGRRRAEEALSESEERFRLIADSAPVPMWVTKLDRTRGFANRAYINFLGVDYEQAVTFDWRTILHPDDADRVLSESMAGEATLKPFVLEGRYRRADGEWRWLRSESQPRWGANGEHEGFIGVAHDITDSKEAEATLRGVNDVLEQRVEERTADLSAALARLQSEVEERLHTEELLRQAQKMEAVGQLTGGIAHDFNNLLTPIMGGLGMIAARLDDPKLKRLAESGLEAARRGAKLTGQLLAFSRTQRLSMTTVEINDVIENMRELLQHTIGGDIEVKIALDPDAGGAICDANQLENAVLNLAINARDAMPDGGTLTILTRRGRLDDAPDVAGGDYVCLSVSDTGIGMTPDVRARATEPFFSTKPVGKGTGLGLAQVYGIAHQPGGTLRIDSAPSIGTTVKVFLPVAPDRDEGEVAVATLETSPHPILASGATILVVDDDPVVRGFLAEALVGLGYEAVEAAGGEQALTMLAQSVPDLLLLDYLMPGMNGADVARAARKEHADLPIVFVTGYAETDQLEGALGCDVPVLRKPFGLSQLTAIVEQNLRR